MAKKFTFELQDILEYRNFEKEQAEGELAKALSVETEINNNLNQIANQYIALKNELKNTTNFDDILAGGNYKKLLEYQKEELLKQLAEAKVITEQKRQILQEIMKKTTALEKLKEQQQEEHKALVDYEESEFVDDLATMRARK